jgi:hypothetical protein
MTKPNQGNEEIRLPYQPSWIDQITVLVDKTGIPYAVVYLVIWIIFLSILTVLRWRDQMHPVGYIDKPDVVMSATGIFFIALVHYLDGWAGKKLTVFRKAIHVNDEEFEELYYRLSTLPPRPAFIASLVTFSIGGITYIISPSSYGFLNIGFESPSSGLQLVNFLFSWFTFGALCYHAFHQLKLGSLATANYLHINLFNLTPIYTFAGLTLRTALGWLVVAYAWAFITPNLFRNLVIIVTILFMQVVAILTFVLPLLSAHDKIAGKKAQTLNEISSRLESVVDEMSRVNDDYDNERLSKLRDMLSTLSMAEERIKKIPTWPWKPSVANSLATAILLPNAVWIFQLLVEKFVLK